MNDDAHLEVQFRVGEVRAAIWHNPNDNNTNAESYRVTTERQRHTGRNEEYVPVLTGGDITKAIIALKKAHQYIQRRGKEPADAGILKSATLHTPHRLP